LFIRATPSSVSVRIDKKDYSRIVISSLAYSASGRVLIAEIGFVETLIKNKQSLLGALCISCFSPRRPGIPPSAITPDKVEKYSEKRGSRGCSPWTASPFGREGGSFSKVPQRICELQKKEDFNRARK